jgi:hypothetical protein
MSRQTRSGWLAVANRWQSLLQRSTIPGAFRIFPVDAERVLDPSPGRLVLAVDALRVDLQQHVNAVARPLGNLRRRHSSVESGRDRRVAELIGQRRSEIL